MRAATCAATARCPRLRGDGPMPLPAIGSALQVSPPTRGWSALADQVVPSCEGVPAYAGMVLGWARLPGPRPRCPRLRGDGPIDVADGPIVIGVSPPTRGWSPARQPRPDRRCGVPAYAGMVPTPGAMRLALFWCPRLRGDGPAAVHMRPCSCAVSPPTRGWSMRMHRGLARRRGVPAYAGMVLAGPPDTKACARCPRLRGDGPGRRDSRRRS